MKKIIVILFISFSALTTINAQVEQGTLLIGGMGGFNTYTSETVYTTGGTTVIIQNPKTTWLNISPYLGFMVTENLAVGLNVGFSSTTTEWKDYPTEGDVTTDKTSLTTVAPGIRYYYVHLDMTHLFASLEVPIGFGKVTNDQTIGGTTTSTESKISSFGVGISPGLSISVGEKCALEAKYGFLGFMSDNTSTESQDTNGDTTIAEVKTSEFGLSWANTFTFGIIFYL